MFFDAPLGKRVMAESVEIGLLECERGDTDDEIDEMEGVTMDASIIMDVTMDASIIMEDVMGGDAECPICLDRCQSPTVSTNCCGVTYCGVCLERWLQTPATTCPNCRQRNPTDKDVVLVSDDNNDDNNDDSSDGNDGNYVLVEREVVLAVSPRVVVGGVAIGVIATAVVLGYEIHSLLTM